MAKIWERDNRPIDNAQELLKHCARVFGCLYGQAENGIIKGLVRIVHQVLVGITLNDTKTFGDGLVNVFLTYLNAAAVDRAGLTQ